MGLEFNFSNISKSKAAVCVKQSVLKKPNFKTSAPA